MQAYILYFACIYHIAEAESKIHSTYEAHLYIACQLLSEISLASEDILHHKHEQ